MSFEYYTTTDEMNMFQLEQSPFTQNKNEFEINVNSHQTFQKIDGWGTSLTDSSAYLVDKCLSEEQQIAVMEALFDSKKESVFQFYETQWVHLTMRGIFIVMMIWKKIKQMRI
ncbi:hypothetical protein [Enterococcus gallinarum]|uniref:hypothetical protein n=1 Tax=Enterococcus gallinarum TaxID=1353 RepID=UPI001F169AB9|nr:hypothetical protein [Enterococcus gallinarum]